VVHRATPESRPSVILWRYLHSWRIVRDLLCAGALPVDMAYSLDTPAAGLLCLFRLAYIQEFVRKLEKTTKASPRLAQTLQFLVGALISLHWIACLWASIAARQGSWLTHYLMWRDDTVMCSIAEVDTSQSETYLLSLYWTLDTASTRGSAEMQPRTLLEVFLSMFTTIFCTLLYSAIIATMSSIFFSQETTWSAHRRRTESIKAFMRHRNLPKPLRTSIQSFLDYMWETHKGIDEASVLQELPPALKKQASLFCAEHLIGSVPIFRNSSPEVNAAIMAALVPRVYVPDETIISRGTWGEDCYMIDHGVAVVVGEDGSPERYYSDGAYFGELAVLFEGRRSRTVVAATHCYLYSLSATALDEILAKYPQCISNLVENIVSLYKKADVARFVKVQKDRIRVGGDAEGSGDG